MMNSIRRLNILLSLLIIGLSASAQINISGVETTVRKEETELEKYSAEIENQHKIVYSCLKDFKKLGLGKDFGTLLKSRKEHIEARLMCNDI